MTKRKLFIEILLLTFVLTACTITNKYEEYKGKVIDAETKQPIEGAAVLAVYKVEQASLAGSVTYYADAQETVTDKNGEFKMPAMRVNKFKILSGWDKNPSFTIFKPGYGCFPRHREAKNTPEFIPSWSLPAGKYVVVELPSLKTKDELMKNGSPDINYEIPYEKQKNYISLIDQWNELVGIKHKESKAAFAKE